MTSWNKKLISNYVLIVTSWKRHRMLDSHKFVRSLRKPARPQLCHNHKVY